MKRTAARHLVLGVLAALTLYGSAGAAVITQTVKGVVREGTGALVSFDGRLGQLRAVAVEFNLGEAIQGPRIFSPAGPMSFDIAFDGILTLSVGTFSQSAALHAVRHFDFEGIDGLNDFMIDPTFATATMSIPTGDTGRFVYQDAGFAPLVNYRLLPRVTNASLPSGARDPSFGDYWPIGGSYRAIYTYSVPEPASWAMMLGGLGLVGAALRARRKAAAMTCNRVQLR